MAVIDDLRAKYPMYKDKSDQEILDGYYNKVYSKQGMSKEDFYSKVGFTPPAPAESGFFTQQGKGGLADYLPEGVTNAMQTIDDLTRISADTMSRGYLDKALGPEEQARTQTARDRTSDWLEAPADIASAVATSPYRVAGALGGAVAGGAEGALSEYGHQPNWVPNKDELWDIGKAGVVGSGIGTVGSKLGEWGGKIANAFKGKPPYSTADELYEAAEKAAKRKPTKRNVDTISRGKRMEAAEAANTQGREGFKKIISGMDQPMSDIERVFGPDPSRVKWPAGEKKIINELAYKPTNTAKWLEGAGKVLQGGNLAGSFPLARAVGAVPGMIGTGLRTLAQVQNDMDPATFKKLQTSILDSTGRLKTDKATVDMVRDLFAKTLMQGGETTVTPRITR